MVYDFVIYILVYKKNKQEILQQNFAKIYSTKSQLTRDFHSPHFLEEKGCISGNFSPPALQLKDSVYHIHFLGSAFLFLPFCLVMTEKVLP